MNRIDYYWPKALVKITGIIFIVQLLTEFVGTRKQGYEWVFPLCSVLFGASLLLVLLCLVWNSFNAGER